jgi:Icc protein
MRLREDHGTVWEAPLDESCSVLAVCARDTLGRYDQDVVEPPYPDSRPPARAADGSDRNRIGTWPSKGLLDTQLGPNRNGRKW